jgi:hypothetical protein
MKKQAFPLILQSIQMLKALEIEFKTKKYLINSWLVLINRYTCELITRLVAKGTDSVYKMKKGFTFDNMLQLMMITLECYAGGYNCLRRTIVRHCMCLTQNYVFASKELQEINYWNTKLDLVSNWEANVRQATRCRFLYWQRELFPMLMNDMIRNKAKLNQLNYFLMAMKDPIDMLENIRHLGSAQVAIDNYKKEVFEEFTKNVTHPICRAIEEDLRKQIH